MIASLGVATPIGLLGGLSVSLGYLVRAVGPYAESMPAEPKAFSLFGFIFAWLAALFILTIAMFFGSAIPSMLYSMSLVACMLHWLRGRRGREKLVSTVLGGVLGFLFGIPCTALGMVIAETAPSFALYATLWRWPAILSIDGLFLLWMALIPPVNAIAGVRTGWKIAQRIAEARLYWF